MLAQPTSVHVVAARVKRSGHGVRRTQRSRKAAYIVNPDRYERDQAELSALRRAVFLAEVREAEAEFKAGEAPRFDSVGQLLDDLRR